MGGRQAAPAYYRKGIATISADEAVALEGGRTRPNPGDKQLHDSEPLAGLAGAYARGQTRPGDNSHADLIRSLRSLYQTQTSTPHLQGG